MKDVAARDRILEERSKLVSQFEELTAQWIKSAQFDKEKNEERKKVVADLKQNYWKLDPYIRARSVYDRLGHIGPQGGFVY